MGDIDYSKDKFQGNYHDLPDRGSSATGPPRAKAELYNTSKSGMKKKCLSCGTDDLKADYKYCPNCGLLFI